MIDLFSMRNCINWKLFFILLILSLISVVCIFPYILSLQGDIFAKAGVSIQFLFFAQLLQGLIFFSIAIFLGLFFTEKVHFHLPVLEALLEKGNYQKVLHNILGLSALAGIGSAILIYSGDYLFSLLGAGISTHQGYAPVWQTLLAAFYGGITEEIIMRLFLMTFFIWISMKLLRRDKPLQISIVVSIIIAAIIFGLGHLPITASLTQLTPLIIIRAIVLNGIGGVIFGWLFWKKGLESAMIAHFSADIFLLTILPLLIK
jgi:membrane protease YdiL (CAAX protease family)